MTKKPKLSNRFRIVCDEYIAMFCEKHDFDPDDAYWVADNPGTIVSVGDYYFDFQDIKHDIDNNVPKDKMIEYYDYSLDRFTENKTSVNYRSFLLGMR